MGLGISRFFFPDEVKLTGIGHGGLAGVPVLFDTNYNLLHEESRYIRERALGMWPEADGIDFVPRRIARNTLVSIGRRLLHFRDWSDWSGKRWTTMTFDDVLGYQDDQSIGRNCFERRAVSNETANARADVATDFLAWAQRRRLRGVFEFPVKTTEMLVDGGKRNMKFTVTKRSRGLRAKSSAGRNDGDSSLVDLPERPAINCWLDAMLNKEEPIPRNQVTSKYLICRFIVDTGVRLHEAVAIEKWQWPSRDLIRRCEERGRDHVHLRLVVTKGGAKRTIRMSIKLAKTVRRWIDHKRGALLAAGKKAGRIKDTERLYLSDSKGYEGIPIQRHTVYDCFREVEPRPEGWHPHMARHAYACHRMKDIIAAEMRLDPLGKGPTWIDSRGQFALRVIGRQFGHVGERTTETYLAYLRNSIGMIEENDNWHHELDCTPSR